MIEQEDTPSPKAVSEGTSEALEVVVEAEELKIDPTGRRVDPPKDAYHWATGDGSRRSLEFVCVPVLVSTS